VHATDIRADLHDTGVTVEAGEDDATPVVVLKHDSKDDVQKLIQIIVVFLFMLVTLQTLQTVQGIMTGQTLLVL